MSTYFRAKSAAPPDYGNISREVKAASEVTEVVESQLSMDSQDTLVVDIAPTNGSSSMLPAVSSTSSTATLVNDVEMEPEKLPQTSSQKYFAASFRGRAMSGLQVDLPEGYGGLVFRVPDAHEHEWANARNDATSDRKRASRARRLTDSVKNDDEGLHEDNVEEDTQMHEDDEHRRILRPTATFSSFVLWNPDIPVNEGRDEYLLSLTEWTKLSAEVRIPM